MRTFPTWTSRWICFVTVVLFTSANARADEAGDIKEQLRLLQQQNQQLQEQLNKQQQVIESLTQKISEVESAGQKRETELHVLKTELDKQPVPTAEPVKPFSLGKVMLSGEGGLAFLETGHEGQFPNAEFRVDEAKLFLDAQVWDHVYFFTELNITTREMMNNALQFGELYLDFEEVSRLWGNDRLLNVRVGRFDIPFGEEYLVRDAIDNSLISHSISDIWGVDEGAEIYGGFGKFDYVLAVQNGGASAVRDFNADKSVTARVGFTPTKAWRLSASAMRTGDLSVDGDGVSELWFGPDVTPSLGGAGTTTEFHADLLEGDVQWRGSRGHVKAAGGYVHYDDNDTAADNQRDIYYYYVEGVYNLTKNLYGAARFSQFLAKDGFPIVGNGEVAHYSVELTKDLWLLTLGGGYRWSPNLVLKIEYSLERGKELSGELRDHEDLFGLQLAYRF